MVCVYVCVLNLFFIMHNLLSHLILLLSHLILLPQQLILAITSCCPFHYSLPFLPHRISFPSQPPANPIKRNQTLFVLSFYILPQAKSQTDTPYGCCPVNTTTPLSSRPPSVLFLTVPLTSLNLLSLPRSSRGTRFPPLSFPPVTTYLYFPSRPSFPSVPFLACCPSPSSNRVLSPLAFRSYSPSPVISISLTGQKEIPK